jgi:hypothetical protein
MGFLSISFVCVCVYVCVQLCYFDFQYGHRYHEQYHRSLMEVAHIRHVRPVYEYGCDVCDFVTKFDMYTCKSCKNQLEQYSSNSNDDKFRQEDMRAEAIARERTILLWYNSCWWHGLHYSFPLFSYGFKPVLSFILLSRDYSFRLSLCVLFLCICFLSLVLFHLSRPKPKPIPPPEPSKPQEGTTAVNVAQEGERIYRQDPERDLSARQRLDRNMNSIDYK